MTTLLLFTRMNGNSLKIANSVDVASFTRNLMFVNIYSNILNVYCIASGFGGEQLTANKSYFYCNFICTTLLCGAIVWERVEKQRHKQRISVLGLGVDGIRVKRII